MENTQVLLESMKEDIGDTIMFAVILMLLTWFVIDTNKWRK